LKKIPKEDRTNLMDGWLEKLKKQCGLQCYKHLQDSLLNPTLGLDATPTVPISLLLNEDPIHMALARAEQKVTESLTHLKKIGVLQPQNQMSLSELLGPVDENVMYDGGDEKEIFQAVLEEKPARRDALQAVSTLRDYVADMDEPFAHEFEAMLNKFGHQTCLDEFRVLQPSASTDYFSCKSL
ncbi:hypothetical protein C0989_012422, partial [Termitomyces sp. Mn162]